MKPSTPSCPLPLPRPWLMAVLLLAALPGAAMADQAAEQQMAARLMQGIFNQLVEGWRPPRRSKGMSTVLWVSLDLQGNIAGVGVERSSGHQEFDRSAIEAVQAASRFPAVAALPRDIYESGFRNFELQFTRQVSMRASPDAEPGAPRGNRAGNTPGRAASYRQQRSLLRSN